MSVIKNHLLLSRSERSLVEGRQNGYRATVLRINAPTTGSHMRLTRTVGSVLGAVALTAAVLPAQASAAPAAPVNASSVDPSTPDGTYFPLTPARILDTREGNGAPKAPLGPNQT